MACSELVRLAHVDECDRAIPKAGLDLVQADIANGVTHWKTFPTERDSDPAMRCNITRLCWATFFAPSDVR